MWTKIPCVFGTGFYNGGRAEKPLAYACERCKTSTLLAGWRPELWKSFQRHRWADDVFWIEGRKSSPALFKPVSHFEWIFSEQQFLRATGITHYQGCEEMAAHSEEELSPLSPCKPESGHVLILLSFSLPPSGLSIKHRSLEPLLYWWSQRLIDWLQPLATKKAKDKSKTPTLAMDP